MPRIQDPHQSRQHRYKREDEDALAKRGNVLGGASSGGATGSAVATATHDDPSAHLPEGVDEHEVSGMGMSLFLVSLSMIFAATLAAWIIMRWRNREGWDGALNTTEYVGLALATLVLIGCDVLAVRARRAHEDKPRAKRLTSGSMYLAIAYMVVQTANWLLMGRNVRSSDAGELTMEGFLFLMLTFTHAVHVLGGIVADAVVLGRSRSTNGPREGALRLLERYWRFLSVVWFILVAVILFG